MSFPWRWHSLGSYSGVSSLDTCWGFAVCGSYCLCNSLCSSLRSVLCSYRCSSEWGCCSFIEGHWTSCTEVYFVLGDRRCSTVGIVVEGRRSQNFCSLQIRFGAELLIEHSQGPSRCALDR